MRKKVTRQIEGKIKKRLGIERPSEEEREKWFKQNFRKRENRCKHKNKVEKKDFLAEKIEWLQVKK